MSDSEEFKEYSSDNEVQLRASELYADESSNPVSAEDAFLASSFDKLSISQAPRAASAGISDSQARLERRARSSS